MMRHCAVLAAVVAAAASFSDDNWRPKFHYFPVDPDTQQGFHMQDTTGAYFDETTGLWQVFYLCSPPPSMRPTPRTRGSWCRVSSYDLVNWTAAPVAALTTESACDWAYLETGAITLAPASGRLVAIYSAVGNQSAAQQICAASTSAALEPPVFEPSRGGGVLIANANNGSAFRDPSRALQLAADDASFYLVIGTDATYPAGLGGEVAPGRASLWRNRDGSLLVWEPAGVLWTEVDSPGAKMLECPDLFPLAFPNGSAPDDGSPPVYALLGSETYRRGARWRTGTLARDSNGGGGGGGGDYRLRALQRASVPLDYGYDNKSHDALQYYAPRTAAPLRDSRGLGRRVLFGWVLKPRRNPPPAVANWSFADLAALPRDLSLSPRDGATLHQAFVPELARLRTAAPHRASLALALAPGGAARVFHSPARGRQLELRATVVASGGGCAAAEWRATIEFLRSPNAAAAAAPPSTPVWDEEATALAVRSTSGARSFGLNLTRSAAQSAAWAQPAVPAYVAPLLSEPETGGVTRLHAFVDASVVEAIADDVAAITARVYPTREDSDTVALLLQGAGSDCDVSAELEVYELGAAPVGRAR